MTEPITAPVTQNATETTAPDRVEVLKNLIYTSGRQAGRNVEFSERANYDGFGFTMTPSPVAERVFVSGLEIENARDLNDLATRKLAILGL